jgi:DNA repair exonuclease SbcCD ATPase subunit
MRPLKIKATNFLPFFGTVEIDLNDISSAIISGRNGTGKTSIIVDSILFACHGRARKNPEGLIHDLADDMRVVFTFEHQSQVYIIERSIQRSKAQKMTLTLDADGSTLDLTERLISNTQKKLDEILGFSHELLLATSVAQQEEVNRLFNMQPAQREQIFMEMLSLGYWDDKKTKAAELIRENKGIEDRLEELESEDELIKGQIDELRLQTVTDNSKLDEFQKKFSELSAIELQERGLLQIKEQREELKAKTDTLQGAVAQLEEAFSRSEELPTKESLKELIEENEAELGELKDLEDEIVSQKGELEARAANLIDKQSHVKALIIRDLSTTVLERVPCRGTQYHTTCDLLLQARNSKTEIDAYLLGLSSKYGNLDEVLNHFTALKSEADEKVQFLVSSKESLKTKRAQHELNIFNFKNQQQKVGEKHKLKIELSAKREELEQLQAQLVVLPTVDVTKLFQAQNDLKQLADDVKKLEIAQAQISTKQDLLLGRANQIKQEHGTLKEESEKIASYRTLHQAYNDIPALLFAETIPHVENYANEILNKITPTRKVVLRTHRETKAGTQRKALDIVCITSMGERDFDNLSGSEKFRYSLALRIALARVNAELYNTQISFFIVDEGFGSLDDINVFVIKQALQKVASEFSLFLVITHVQDLKDTFDTELVVSTLNNGSKIDIIKHKVAPVIILDE